LWIMDWCRLPVSCAVSVKAFPTAASARQTASGSGRGSVTCWLLALFGPVAVRVKAAPVVPGFVASVAGGDDAPSQLQQQLLGGLLRQGIGVGRAQCVA